MRSEAGFGATAVRYTSVDTGFRGPSGPQTVAEPATDEHGQAYGRARTSLRTRPKKPRTGPVGAVIPTVLLAFPWPGISGCLSTIVVSLVTGLGLAGLLARLADSAALPSVYRQSHVMVD
jgi:hypothetical protein